MNRGCVLVAMVLFAVSPGRAKQHPEYRLAIMSRVANGGALRSADSFGRGDLVSHVSANRMTVSSTVDSLHGFASPRPKKIRSGTAKEQTLSISVHVHDYAQVSHDILKHAQREISYVLGAARVETTWFDGSVASEQRSPCPGCQSGLPSAHVFLRLLPRAEGAERAFPATALGFAVSPVNGEGGSVANVFYDRVTKLASGADPSESHVLAMVAAHEIGHLLLPMSGHSADGIMRAQWSRDDLLIIRSISLIFTPEQSRLIRANLLRRIGQPAASLEPSAGTSRLTPHALGAENGFSGKTVLRLFRGPWERQSHPADNQRAISGTEQLDMEGPVAELLR